eukprot:754041-Hanusia_phi.AAC.2
MLTFASERRGTLNGFFSRTRTARQVASLPTFEFFYKGTRVVALRTRARGRHDDGWAGCVDYRSEHERSEREDPTVWIREGLASVASPHTRCRFCQLVDKLAEGSERSRGDRSRRETEGHESVDMPGRIRRSLFGTQKQTMQQVRSRSCSRLLPHPPAESGRQASSSGPSSAPRTRLCASQPSSSFISLLSSSSSSSSPAYPVLHFTPPPPLPLTSHLLC